MHLEKNVTAPLFKVNDVYGRMIDLSAFRGRKVLIAFFRHTGCPFCNLRVHALSKVHEELKSAGLDMIFFFESKEKVILRSSFHVGVSPIPIIADPEKYWFGMYGLERSLLKSGISHISSFVQAVSRANAAGIPVHMPKDGESLSTIPAEFLLDKNFVIKKLHYSQRLDDRLEIDSIKAFVNDSNAFDNK